MLSEIEFSKNVIHGDYTFSNVILSKNGKAFILDWGHVHLEKKNLIKIWVMRKERFGRIVSSKNEKLDNVDRKEVI